MMARCYVCSETTTTDERIVSESWGTEFLLCPGCAGGIICDMEAQRIRLKAHGGRDVE